MALADDILKSVSAGWALVQAYGFSPYTVTVRTRTWSTGKVQSGTPTDVDLLLTPNPQVEEVNGDRQLKLYGITPTDGTIGYTKAQLVPPDTAGVQYYYVVTGPNGTHNYSVASINTSDRVEYTLVLDALTRATPF